MIRFQGRTSKSLFSDFTIETRFYQLRLRTFQDGIQPEAAPVTAKRAPVRVLFFAAQSPGGSRGTAVAYSLV
jgi:hypothetical protein